jgi:hypothetical protein
MNHVLKRIVMITTSAAAAFCLMAGMAGNASAQSVKWRDNTTIIFGQGTSPSVALGGGESQSETCCTQIVAVHLQSPNDMRWSFGLLNSVGMSDFGQVTTDTSVAPAIASVSRDTSAMGNSYFFLEVNGDGAGNLVYRVLRDGGWSAPVVYAQGYNPSLASDGFGGFVEVHQELPSGVGRLFYMVGSQTVDPFGTILVSFNTDPTEYDRGINPTVGMSSSGAVLEVHQGSTDRLADLQYHAGCYLTFGLGGIFQNRSGVPNNGSTARGTNPSVALANTFDPGAYSFAVLAYQQDDGLIYQTAITPDFCSDFGSWTGATVYGRGRRPRLGIQNGTTTHGGPIIGLEVHQGAPVGGNPSPVTQHGFTVF